jgi:cytoskeleton protein RodZ
MSTSTIALPSVEGTAAPPAVTASAAGRGAGCGSAPAPVAAPSAPASIAAAAPAAAAEVAAERPQAPPTIPVQVIAAEDSWVEVVDAQGRMLLSRTVVAGESVGLDGPLPMRVKIGNAHGTRLTLRGDNVDLGPWTRDNVARLELK